MVIKAKAFLALATLGVVLPLTGTLGVRAAETGAPGSELVGTVGSPATGSAKVQVEPGELAFKKDAKDSAIVPSFVFNSPQVGKPQSDLSLKSDVSDVTDMQIENNQGTGSSWQVVVSLGALTTEKKVLDKKRTLQGATLNLKPTVTGNQLSNPENTIHVIAGDQAKSLLIAKPGAGMNDVSLSLAGATLTLPTTTWAGDYTASLTYTLTSGPTGTPAN